MPDHVSRFTVALYDQYEDEPTADWGGDDLFTRMPRPPKPDTAPAPRFRPALALVEPPAERRRFVRPEERREEEWRRDGGREPRAGQRSGGKPSGRETRGQEPVAPPLALVDPSGAPPRTGTTDGRPGPGPAPLQPATVRQWEGSFGAEPAGRPMRTITGHPDGASRAARARAERHRPARGPADWIGPRPERLVAWAFALGLVLILVAISTADAATL